MTRLYLMIFLLCPIFSFGCTKLPTDYELYKDCHQTDAGYAICFIENTNVNNMEFIGLIENSFKAFEVTYSEEFNMEALRGYYKYLAVIFGPYNSNTGVYGKVTCKSTQSAGCYVPRGTINQMWIEPEPGKEKSEFCHNAIQHELVHFAEDVLEHFVDSKHELLVHRWSGTLPRLFVEYCEEHDIIFQPYGVNPLEALYRWRENAR